MIYSSIVKTRLSFIWHLELTFEKLKDELFRFLVQEFKSKVVQGLS